MSIAYPVFGGSSDLVLVPGWISNLDVAWEDPNVARFLDRLSFFARVIQFDKRGTGFSDRVEAPTLEQRMDDVRAVMDAAGSESAVLFGSSEGGAMVTLFAATYPDRTKALVLHAAFPRLLIADDYPLGRTPTEQLAIIN